VREMKPHLTFFTDGVTQYHVVVSTISTNYLPSSHPIAPPLPIDVEYHAHTLVQFSHPPNITSLIFHIELVVSPSSSHMNSIL